MVGNKVTVTKHVAVPQNQFQINPYGSLSQGMVPMTHRKVTDGLAKLRHQKNGRVKFRQVMAMESDNVH